MDDGVARFSTRFGGNLLTCGRRSLVSETQNEIVVSWITLWGMMKVYWLDLTLVYIFDHAVCCASAASSGRSLHLITSQLRTKQSSSNCPNHVRRTKSSINKRITVRRTVRSMFGEQTFAQLRTGFRQPWNTREYPPHWLSPEIPRNINLTDLGSHKIPRNIHHTDLGRPEIPGNTHHTDLVSPEMPGNIHHTDLVSPGEKKNSLHDNLPNS